MGYPIATLREIHEQPEVWDGCFRMLDAFEPMHLVLDRRPGDFEWIFVGCGTSYYLAQAAAASFTLLTGHVARALPASEILLHPALSLPQTSKTFLVLISRSGHTSEVLSVAEFLREQGQEFLVLTCDGNELALTSPRLLKLPVKETSTVMTASFTSMLLAMQYLAAKLAGNMEFVAGLRALPEAVRGLMEKYSTHVEAFAARPFEDVAVLGQGAMYPIASEFALKVMESSSSYAQFFHTLEFRHGPKSIINEKTLVVGLISETGAEDESKVIAEMKALGAATIVVANRASTALTKSADLLIEVALDSPELSRLCAYVVWGQMFGSYAGLAKGLDPDNPRNLSRVVTI